MKTLASPWTEGNPMPGWGIVADLTPPELIASRRLAVVRRLVIGAFALVVLLCAGGYGYAIWQNDSANDGLVAEQANTASLLAQQSKYSAVTTVRGTIASVRTQLAGLMADDVNVGKLVAAVVAARPAGMTIDQMDVAVSVAGTSAATQPQTDGVSGLDLSGETHIGSITLSGKGTKLTDLAAYVDALGKVPGVFEPYPLSNQTTTAGAGGSGAPDTPGTTYSLQLTLTDALLTHRFDIATGAK